MISVGTSNRFRSSVKSVSEKALMQSYAALKTAHHSLPPPVSIIPCETFAPGRLKP